MIARKLLVILLAGALAPAGAFARGGGGGDGKGKGDGGGGGGRGQGQQRSVQKQSGRGQQSARSRGSSRNVRVAQQGNRVRSQVTSVEYTRKGNVRTAQRNSGASKSSKRDTTVVYDRGNRNRNDKVRPTGSNNRGNNNRDNVVVYDRNGRGNNNNGHHHHHGRHVENNYYYRGGYYRPWYGGWGWGWGSGWGWNYPSSYVGVSFPVAAYAGYANYSDGYDESASVEVLVQEELADLGYYNGNIDGIIGPASRRAISDYQYSNGLAPTGRIDDALLDSLNID